MARGRSVVDGISVENRELSWTGRGVRRCCLVFTIAHTELVPHFSSLMTT